MLKLVPQIRFFFLLHMLNFYIYKCILTHPCAVSFS
jgi:hypothetical protein